MAKNGAELHRPRDSTALQIAAQGRISRLPADALCFREKLIALRATLPIASTPMKPNSTVVSVVLVGSFSPAKFMLPSLQGANALSASDLASAAYEMLVRDQVVHISLPWGSVQVIQDRLTVDVFQAPYVRASDLILKCLKEVAAGAIVRQMGINLRSEYMYLDAVGRDVLGRRLLPAAAWGPWGQEVAESQNLPATSPMHGGLACAILRQHKPPIGGVEGHIDARVDSLLPTTAGWGVSILINDHYELLEASNGGRHSSDLIATATLLDVFERSFDESVSRSMKIANGIVEGTS